MLSVQSAGRYGSIDCHWINIARIFTVLGLLLLVYACHVGPHSSSITSTSTMPSAAGEGLGLAFFSCQPAHVSRWCSASWLVLLTVLTAAINPDACCCCGGS
ncbi:hypothetical protein E2C01_066065 [Portunus trituberculatus]|uniref:Uncharacterized protein n=1 Tax=Portunus trituberculatus TaxID=210409 RepID=A0A5B7HPA7_PORTR|nr:hypothetical protein [Portunus trituberculatus]